jgi:hypothetical protein
MSQLENLEFELSAIRKYARNDQSREREHFAHDDASLNKERRKFNRCCVNDIFSRNSLRVHSSQRVPRDNLVR